jgi:5-methylcytosine-specific restriction endonuclease McrA
MAKLRKQATRAAFREAVFTRDGYRCRVCGASDTELDAHHISDRTTMPDGGYVKENGISLCKSCHRLAEQLWETGVAAPGFTPDQLYALIGSSHTQALRASEAKKDF